MYDRLFDWIVRRLNTNIEPKNGFTVFMGKLRYKAATESVCQFSGWQQWFDVGSTMRDICDFVFT